MRDMFCGFRMGKMERERAVTGIRFSAGGMFHGKHDSIGYYSADFSCETFSATASDGVIKGYKRLWETSHM